MKVTIDLENLEHLVQNSIEENIETVVRKQVDNVVRKMTEEVAKGAIEDKVSESFQRFVDEYITNTKIKIGGGYWDDSEAREYTVEEYIKKQLKEKLESNSLRVKASRYNSEYKNVTFEEYIKSQFDFNEEIKKAVDEFTDGIRKQVNDSMKEAFDNSTKNMLSAAVLNILNANDTYRKLENNIKCIADKRE
jgi:hypothetical protein